MSSHHQETPAQPVEIDAWHEPHGVAPMQEHGSHVNIRFLLIFFVAIVLFILVTVAALFVFFAHSQTNLRTKLVENTYEYETQYMPYATEAKGRIGEYGWVDRQAGTVRIPWDVAARGVVATYSGPASDAEESND